MERTIMIDGRKVKFKATGLTPALYRQHHQRELFDDISMLQAEQAKAASENKGMSGEALQAFERMAYTMAKQADPEETPDNMEEWLDSFGFLSIYRALPDIVALWNLNEVTKSESKKKAPAKRRER